MSKRFRPQPSIHSATLNLTYALQNAAVPREPCHDTGMHTLRILNENSLAAVQGSFHQYDAGRFFKPQPCRISSHSVPPPCPTSTPVRTETFVIVSGISPLPNSCVQWTPSCSDRSFCQPSVRWKREWVLNAAHLWQSALFSTSG